MPKSVNIIYNIVSKKKMYTLQDRFSQKQIYSLDCFDFNLVAKVTKCYIPPKLTPLGEEK